LLSRFYPHYRQVHLKALTMLILKSWDSLSIKSLGLNLRQERLKVFLGKPQMPPKHDGFICPLQTGWIEGIARQLTRVNRQATDNIPEFHWYYSVGIP
jgi:hypothetical protein